MNFKKLFYMLIITYALNSEQISEPCSFIELHNGNYLRTTSLNTTLSQKHRDYRSKKHQIKIKKTNIENHKNLEEMIFSLKKDNFKIYIYNSKKFKNDVFDIRSIPNYKIFPLFQDVSFKIDINIPEILNILFHDKLDKEDYFLQDIAIINKKKSYTSKKALDQILKEITI